MLYFSDAQFADLPPRIAAEEGGLEKEKVELEKQVSRGLEAVKASQTVRREYDGLMTAITDLGANAQVEEDGVQASRKAAFTEAAGNPAYDNDGAIAIIERHQKRASYFHDAKAFVRRYLVPQVLLRTLEADAKMAAAHCSVASQRAMVSAVERFRASQALLEAEGVVEFSPVGGRTAGLVEEARQAFKVARAAAEAVTNEKSRQIGLETEGVK